METPLRNICYMDYTQFIAIWLQWIEPVSQFLMFAVIKIFKIEKFLRNFVFSSGSFLSFLAFYI